MLLSRPRRSASQECGKGFAHLGKPCNEYDDIILARIANVILRVFGEKPVTRIEEHLGADRHRFGRCGGTTYHRSTPALRNEEMSSRGKGSVSGRVITPPQRVE